MQQHILPTEDLTGIYRYALLLAGDPRAAQSALLEVFADAGEKINHFRSGKSCEAWLVAKVRSRLLNRSFTPTDSAAASPDSSGHADPAVLDLAIRFSRLLEPGRSALALLYIDRFSVVEIAQILQLRLEQFAEAIDTARNALRASASPATPASVASIAPPEPISPIAPEITPPAEGAQP